MRDFQELSIWKRSHQLTLKVYQISNLFPSHELYGLISQIRRSASSIPTNIAEGCGKSSNAEMKNICSLQQVHAQNWNINLSYQKT